jgi:hypothetical protein
VNGYYGQFEASLETSAGEPPSPAEASAEESVAEAVAAGETAAEKLPVETAEPENESVRIENTASSEPQ